VSESTATAHGADETAVGRDQQLMDINITLLRDSEHNPRKHYDKRELEELAASIEKVGVLTPLIARLHPNDDGTFELAAGHRRLRALQLIAARTPEMVFAPVIVREMDDATFIEAINVENLQRTNLHPLEEAEGFKTLLTLETYNIARIADRVGRDKSYVYDRLRLLDLVPPLKKLFLQNRFTLAHAVILSRLTKDEQKKAGVIEKGEAVNHYPGNRVGGLWTPEYAGALSLLELEREFEDDEEEKDPYARLKPVTPKELQSWVNKHTRFNEEAKDVADLFPETKVKLEQAKEKAIKVIHITTEQGGIGPDLKDPNERIYGPRSWTRADGLFESKPCDHSVMGVIVVGAGRGESFLVCTAKEKCEVHYGREIRERRKREKERLAGGDKKPDRKAEQARQEREEKKRQEEAAARQLEEKRWQKAWPYLIDAIAKIGAKGDLGHLAELVTQTVARDGENLKRLEKSIKPGATAESILRYLGAVVLATQMQNPWALMNEYHGPRIRTLAKRMGLDLDAILEDAAPVPKKDAEIQKAEASPKKAKKGGKAKR
jgi:ParB/RepB/Spo0J family partition protein